MGEHYTIHHHTEEFECPECGFPCCIGEEVYDDGPRVYCSRYCAELAHQERLTCAAAECR